MRMIDLDKSDPKISELAELSVQGESLIIVKAGKPLAQLTPLDPPTVKEPCRVGFLAGQGTVPEDFDQIGESEIWAMFRG